MAAVNSRDAAYMAQAVLQKKVDSNLNVDGRWGGHTHRVYSAAPVAVRLTIDGMLALAGTTASGLLEQTRVAERNHVMNDFDDIIEKEARAAGVSPSIMQRMLKIENPRRDPRAVSKNGSSHGLFQIQQKTWEGVLRNNRLTEPGWDKRYDAASNAKIACLLTRENAESIRKMGYKEAIDGRILYLVHQQGPAGAMEIYQRATGRPVTKSVINGARLEDNLPRSVTNRTPQGFAEFWWKKAGEVML